MIQKNIYIMVLFVFILATSCVSKKDIVYFQNDVIDQSKVSNSYKTIIKPDDLLQISINALDIEAIRPFNLAAVAFTNSSDRAVGLAQQQTYLVDTDVEIDNNYIKWHVTRVPSGWIYSHIRLDSGQMNTVFVPFDNHFQGV